MKEKNREREKKKCCLDKNLKKKNVVVVASSCTHTHRHTNKHKKGLVSCCVVVLHQPFIIITILNRTSSIFHILPFPSGFDLTESLFLVLHRFSSVYYLYLARALFLQTYFWYLVDVYVNTIEVKDEKKIKKNKRTNCWSSIHYKRDYFVFLVFWNANCR